MENLLSWIMFSLVLFAGWHFFVERIVGPSVRFKLRMELFSVRDELRDAIIDNGDEAAVRAAEDLHKITNTAIDTLADWSPSSIIQFGRLVRENPELRRRVESRKRAFDQPSVRDTAKRIERVSVIALIVNAGGWAVYVIPLVLSWVLARRLTGMIRSLLSAPSDEYERLSPSLFCHN